MSKQVLPTGKLAKMLEGQLGKIDKKFWSELGKFNLPKIINDLILKGISPVAGVAGRFVQYSKNYIDVIRGEARFIGSKGGGSIRIEAPKSTSIKRRKKSDGGGFVAGKEKTHYFEKGLGVGKKVSPVNLKVTGEMQNSLSYNPNTGILTANHERWVFHNEGMGKLPVRRLLPNKEGERFNRRIEQVITETLGKVLGVKGNKAKRFIKVKYNIR